MCISLVLVYNYIKMHGEIKHSTLYYNMDIPLKRQDSKIHQQRNINVQLDQTAIPFDLQSFLFTAVRMLGSVISLFFFLLFFLRFGIIRR